VRNGMMQAVVSDPTRGVAGTVEDGPKNQNLLDEPVHLKSAVCQQAVVTHSGPQAAQTCKEQREPEYFQAGNRKQDDPYDAQNVDQDKIDEHAFFASNRFPEGPIPWLRHRDCAVSHFRSATPFIGSIIGFGCFDLRTFPPQLRTVETKVY